MNKIYYIIIALLLIIHTADAQLVKETVHISWNEPLLTEGLKDSGEDAWMLRFDGAINHQETGWLPIYVKELPLQTTEVNVDITVTDPVFEYLELKDSSFSLLDSQLVPGEWHTFFEIVINRKKPYLLVYLLPLQKNVESGRVNKLLSCKLEIAVERSQHEDVSRQMMPVPSENSVLRDGAWYKISISKSGIYKIGYDDLLSFGIDPGAVMPGKIRIFGNGGKMLSESTSQPRPDDLIENAIYVNGEEDGRFDQGDYILFYGQGPVFWTYNPFYQIYDYQVHLYSDKVYYFLNINDSQGKRIGSEQAVPADPDIFVTTTDDFGYHEEDSLNLIKSGKEWYGDVYHDKVTYDYVFTFPNIHLESTAYFKANFVARATESSQFNIMLNGEYLGEQEIGSVQVGSSIYARTMTTRIIDFMPNDTVLKLTIEYSKPNNTSTGWLNYIQVNAVSNLVFNGGQKTFRNVGAVESSDIAQYEIATAAANVQVWDITDPYNCQEEEVFTVSGGYGIRVTSDSLREFTVFDGSSYYQPAFEEKLENQNLHGLIPSNMVIVVHPSLMSEALRLADFHRQHSQLTVNVVTPQQIYNEFSSGAQDVTAIRDFLKMLYDRNDDMLELRYLLLFGDASYDYKDRLPEDNNLVPTFQSKESLKMASSFVTDDFFGCLDYGEGSNASGTVDIGIGRFPVRNLEEAKIIVDKIIHYATASDDVAKPWRNNICLVADDEDNNIHLNQAEELAEIIDTSATAFNVNKVYLDSYLQESSPLGYRYPEASKAINKVVDHGALFVNYTGHGGETGWAHEKVLDMPMILSWDNYDRLPAFVTATCEFSRFDDPGLVSAGEWVILNSRGGGIGLFTTTRLAYSQSNAALNKRFYQAAFIRDTVTGEYPRMGDLMRAAKTPSSQNIKNFVLLGDPALMLAYPTQKVRTTSINHVYSGKETDTLKALTYVTINGQVEDINGNMLAGFNGKVFPTVYDKPVVYQTRANDNNSRVTDFTIQNKVLYKGEVTATEGQFSYSFIVPRDISYQLGWGKISYYATDTNTFQDAHGYTEVLVGGSDDMSVADEQGPVIEIYLNDTTFRSGDVTTSSPLLLVRLYDESGINTVGNGIGHDLSAILDENTQNPLVLNDYYTPDQDTYQSGWIAYPLGKIQPGLHSLSLKAWDIYNNSSEEEVTFVIDTISPLYLKKAFNYPNPFRNGTHFIFSHNKPGSHFDVVIDIYRLDGRFVKSLRYSFISENLESDPMPWDGRDATGHPLGAGMYIYRLTATSGNGKIASVSQKLILIN
jgi:hypothetical protein